MRLAIIPARGGSKRVPGKNTRLFCGQPMLSYAIRSALASRAIDAVWVSTDEVRTADLARRSGAEVPFLRPAELADDHTVLQAVMRHALTHAREAGLTVTHAALVFATAPMLDPADLDRGFETLLASDADEALAVTEFPFAPQRAQRVNAHGHLEYVSPAHRATRSQDLEPCYHDAAQFVWGHAATFVGMPGRTPGRVVPVRIDPSRVVDIDTPADWIRAERMYRLLNEPHPFDEQHGRLLP